MCMSNDLSRAILLTLFHRFIFASFIGIDSFGFRLLLHVVTWLYKWVFVFALLGHIGLFRKDVWTKVFIRIYLRLNFAMIELLVCVSFALDRRLFNWAIVYVSARSEVLKIMTKSNILICFQNGSFTNLFSLLFSAWLFLNLYIQLIHLFKFLVFLEFK